MHLEGCDRATARFLIESWKPNTQKAYQVYLKQWNTFCLIRRVNKRKPTNFQVCSFLRELSEKEKSYSTVNKARCALSLYLPRQDNGETMGKEFWVTRAVKSASDKNPGQAKHSYFWDVTVVFDLFKSWGPNSSLSLKCLVKKLVVLLLLVTGQRGQVALLMHLDKMSQDDMGVVSFALTGQLKTARVGERNKLLALSPYDREPRVCVVRTLKEYLKRMAPVRANSGETSLFLSYVRPFEAVERGTISRWVKDVLGAAGVDTNQFGGHSTRGAGVSAGARLGVITDVLLRYGSWKSQRTMAKHYLKEVRDESAQDLGQVLLDCLA